MPKIAIVSSLYKPTRIDAIGGQETWTAQFALGLAEKGYKIDLYALPGSIEGKGIKLYPITDLSLDGIKKTNLKNKAFAIGEALYAKVLTILIKNSYPLVIDSSGSITIPLNSYLLKAPVIVIGHFPVNHPHVAIFQKFQQPQNLFYVFPSHFQNKMARWIKNSFVIPHGIKVENFKFSPKNELEKSFWVGRETLDDKKGLRVAIKVHKKLKIPLEAYVSFDSPELKREFLAQESKHLKIYESSHSNRVYNKFSTPGRYKVLIYPINWDEPFGLVLLESLACGTPVIAYNRGAFPEIIENGKSGFIVRADRPEELEQAIKKLYSLPIEKYLQMRINARKSVEKRFNFQNFIEAYIKLINKLL